MGKLLGWLFGLIFGFIAAFTFMYFVMGINQNQSPNALGDPNEWKDKPNTTIEGVTFTLIEIDTKNHTFRFNISGTATNEVFFDFLTDKKISILITKNIL